MNFGDTFTTVFVMLLITIIFFIFPLLFISNELDSASQLTLQTNMTNFINQICDTGKLTKEDFDKFIETITGPNNYDIQIEVKVLDENPSRKVTIEDDNSTSVGENAYVTYYTSQIVGQLDTKGYFLFKEGDQIHIYIKNTNKTMSQLLSTTIDSDISTIIAEKTQTCLINGI